METVENLQISVYEREALQEAMHKLKEMREPERSVMAEAIEQIAKAGDLAGRKRQSNRRTEPLRRRLVGAQMQADQADRVKECAEILGLSVYRFVTNCLEEACQRVQGPSPDQPLGPRSTSSLSAPQGLAWVRALLEAGQENVQTYPPGVTDCPAEGEAGADLQGR